ncbi:MAG: hypothetical protein J6S85_19480 [Methanobrevibacter sp.]|nr:hypothetical protein [Methanobrevibacter sp.]
MKKAIIAFLFLITASPFFSEQVTLFICGSFTGTIEHEKFSSYHREQFISEIVPVSDNVAKITFTDHYNGDFYMFVDYVKVNEVITIEEFRLQTFNIKGKVVDIGYNYITVEKDNEE